MRFLRGKQKLIHYLIMNPNQNTNHSNISDFFFTKSQTSLYYRHTLKSSLAAAPLSKTPPKKTKRPTKLIKYSKYSQLDLYVYLIFSLWETYSNKKEERYRNTTMIALTNKTIYLNFDMVIDFRFAVNYLFTCERIF
jgi:hypothetical protein